MSAGRSYLSALRSEVELLPAADDLEGLMGLGGSLLRRFATTMLCTLRERRREEDGPEPGVLEPDDEDEDSAGDGALLLASRVGRGRGSGGRETFASTGMLMTIMFAGLARDELVDRRRMRWRIDEKCGLFHASSLAYSRGTRAGEEGV